MKAGHPGGQLYQLAVHATKILVSYFQTENVAITFTDAATTSSGVL